MDFPSSIGKYRCLSGEDNLFKRKGVESPRTVAMVSAALIHLAGQMNARGRRVSLVLRLKLRPPQACFTPSPSKITPTPSIFFRIINFIKGRRRESAAYYLTRLIFLPVLRKQRKKRQNNLKEILLIKNELDRGYGQAHLKNSCILLKKVFRPFKRAFRGYLSLLKCHLGFLKCHLTSLKRHLTAFKNAFQLLKRPSRSV